MGRSVRSLAVCGSSLPREAMALRPVAVWLPPEPVLVAPTALWCRLSPLWDWVSARVERVVALFGVSLVAGVKCWRVLE